MNKPKSVIFFKNGNTVVSDANGEQIPELQKSWFMHYCNFLISEGIDIESVKFETEELTLKPFKIDVGFNWQVDFK